MKTQATIVSRSCNFIVAVVCLAGTQGACINCNEGVLVQQEQRAQAMLTSARVKHVTLFGDLPYTGRQAFSNRPAISAMQHTFTEVGSDFDADIDRSGERIVFSSTRHSVQPDLYVKHINGIALTQLTSDVAADIHPSFSPDGTRVAFASHRGGDWDIWVMSIEGGPPMQVTRGPADEVHPSWSPDGTRIVYCSLPANGGQWELWLADAGSIGAAQFIGYGLFPEWSPAGDRIVYQRARERGSRWFSIWSLTLGSNGEPSYPTELAGGASVAMILPTWSPDGSRIAFVTTGTANVPTMPAQAIVSSEIFDIWVMNADGRSRVRLTDGYTANFTPAFGSDNRVYFTSNRAGHENIWSLAAPGLLQQGGSTAMRKGAPTPRMLRPRYVRGGF